MRYFKVDREELSGQMMTAEVYADGEYADLPSEIGEIATITMGFSVTEYGDDYMIKNVEFYPVKTDMESMSDNSAEVLEKIKQDYPAGEWQNDNW